VRPLGFEVNEIILALVFWFTEVESTSEMSLGGAFYYLRSVLALLLCYLDLGNRLWLAQ